MHNKILHAVSNRPGPFVTPLLAGNLAFTPKVLSIEEKAFRSKLFLDVTDTDYYLKVYLAALHGFADMERLFEDYVTTYRIEDFPPRGVEVSGGELVSKANMVAYFTDAMPTSLPVNLHYEISYLDSVYLELSAIESGLVETLAYQITGQDSNGLLRFDWKDFPFTGPIQLNQTWIAGAKVQISVEPSQFPYQVLLDAISGDLWINQVLVDAGLITAFKSTTDLQEKLAIALLVLGASNTSVFPPATIYTDAEPNPALLGDLLPPTPTPTTITIV